MDTPKPENDTTRTPKNTTKWIKNIYEKIEKTVGKIGTKKIEKAIQKNTSKWAIWDSKMSQKRMQKCSQNGWPNASKNEDQKRIQKIPPQ
jgi:hypothetical protein